MAIFLDSGQLELVQQFHRMGIIRGVTTNPTILVKEGLVGGMPAIRARSIEIAQLIAPLPLSVEVLTNDPKEMLRQAQEFAGWAENIAVKITIHGPNGEIENLEVIHELESVHDVRVNVTAMMNAQQCFLAAMAGATYVSLFAGRVNDMGCDSIAEITRLRTLLDRYALKAQIIAASTREVLNVIDWLAAGAHIVTVTPPLLQKMIVHPYSKETVQMFLSDAKKLAETVLV